MKAKVTGIILLVLLLFVSCQGNTEPFELSNTNELLGMHTEDLEDIIGDYTGIVSVGSHEDYVAFYYEDYKISLVESDGLVKEVWFDEVVQLSDITPYEDMSQLREVVGEKDVLLINYTASPTLTVVTLDDYCLVFVQGVGGANKDRMYIKQEPL